MQATGMTASLRIQSSKADSNTWESFTRSELKLEKHLTWAKEKKNWTVAQWSTVLFSDESTFCISFCNILFRSLTFLFKISFFIDM